MLYPPKETLLFLSERFWMKKTFSLVEGVFLYAETEKMIYSPKETKT